MKRRLNTLKGKRLVTGDANLMTKDEICINATPNGVEVKEIGTDGKIKDLAGNANTSSQEDDCWYIMECHDYGNGLEIDSYFVDGIILEILYCDQLQSIYANRGAHIEEKTAEIQRVGPPSYGWVDAIGALVIPKKINGYDGFKQLLKYARYESGMENKVDIIDTLLADNYNIQDFIKFINEEIAIDTEIRYVLVSKSECYRICNYVDDENMK